jgi:TGF-beta propeptide
MDDVTVRALVLMLAIAFGICGPGASAVVTHTVRLAPVQDVSLSFWCDWGYDWEERCYRDDGDRLPIGGDDDKLWRAALRFSTRSLPPGSAVVRASLDVFHDGRCLGPRKTTRACEPRSYELEAHPVLGADWFDERELDFGPALTGAELDSAAQPHWLSFDLTDLVAEWVDGSRQNAGVLLKLVDGHETYGASGPSLPSSSFVQTAMRPYLEVTYLAPGG